MVNKHIAESGQKKGLWVDCPAKFGCTLMSSSEHTSAEELNEVKSYILRTTGEDIEPEMVPRSVLASYRTLTEDQKTGVRKFDPISEPVDVVWDEEALVVPQKKFEAKRLPVRPVADKVEKEPVIERIVCKIDNVKTDFMTHKMLKESLDVLKENGCTVSYKEKRRILTVQVKDLEVDGPTDVVDQWRDWLRSAEPAKVEEKAS